MYIFSDNQSNINQFMKQTANGGVTINDTLISVGHPVLPFGGAGKSGIGQYHGNYGFDEFSNHRSVMKRDFDLGASYFYPPYTEKKENIVSNLLKKFSSIL
jgi:aldehyde dehydrogenase (NAD+)